MPGGYRVALAVFVTAWLAAGLTLLIATQSWGAGLNLLFLVVARSALSSVRRKGSLPDFLAQAATRRASEVGREVRPGHWRVDGPAAKAFVAEITQWQGRGPTPAAEPDEVRPEHHLAGDPWPTPPATLAEPWPMFNRRDKD